MGQLLSQLLFSCEFWSVLREALELVIGRVYYMWLCDREEHLGKSPKVLRSPRGPEGSLFHLRVLGMMCLSVCLSACLFV